VETTIPDNGEVVEAITISGPPTPPPGCERPTLVIEEVKGLCGQVMLEVRAFSGVHGCSLTALTDGCGDVASHSSASPKLGNGAVPRWDDYLGSMLSYTRGSEHDG
jgi:hypothetical protein